MIKLMSCRITAFAICLVMVSSLLTTAQASDYKDEAFGFRATKADNYGETNVDPFLYRGNPIKFNSFLIWPNLTLQQEYNDNVYATEDDTKSDWVTSIKPALLIKKEIKRHEFLAYLQAEMRRHWDLNDESIENYQAMFEGTIEAHQGTTLPFMMAFRDGHIKRSAQRRTDINDLSISPLRVRSYEFETGVKHQPNRLGFELLGNFKRADLKNNKLADGTPLIRDTRNLDTIKTTGRVSYNMPTGWEPYAELTWGDDNFINEAPTAITRNNNLVRLLVGTMFDYKGLVYGYLGTGWEKRSYDSATIDSATGLSLDGKITWEPQAKTLVTFDLSRKTFEANDIIAGITETATGIELRHELQRDLFLKLMGGYDNEDFNDSNREDKTLSTGIGLHYISSPHLQVGADYNFTTRSSTVSGLDMDNNILMLRAKMAW